MAKRIDAKMAAKFQKLIETFTLVERVAHINGRKAFENDVEHSYALAMLAWYLADAFELSLDKNTLLRYALAHDLVEVYAGDTYMWDEERKKTKHEREERARLQLVDEFPEFKDLHAAISAYEARDDAESKFIYALDKFIPELKNYIQDGGTWASLAYYEDLMANKIDKVGEQPEVKELLRQLIALVDESRSHYFVK